MADQQVSVDDRAPIEAVVIRSLGHETGNGAAAQARVDDEIRLRFRTGRGHTSDRGA